MIKGLDAREIAAATQLKPNTVHSTLRTVRWKLACPERCSSPSSPTALASGQITAPTPQRPAPDLSPEQISLLKAAAEHTLPRDIAFAAALAPADVRDASRPAPRRHDAQDSTELVVLAHSWQLLSAEQAPTRREAGRPSDPARDPHGQRGPLRPVPFTQGAAAAIYEMRMLSTRPSVRKPPPSSRTANAGSPARPARTRPSQHPRAVPRGQTLSAGLFEDGRLLSCHDLEHTPDLGMGPGALASSCGCDPPLPGQSDDITRLITLWASDFAARLDLTS
ncbi:hypothetical protein GCM10023238_26760 [Streptomyces heliomycini]